MSKSVSVEHIADLYLQELRKQEKKDSKAKVQLMYLLDKKKVYYDQKMLNEACALLIRIGYVDKGLPGMHGVGYDKTVGFTSGNLKAMMDYHRLTTKGRDFVDHKQKLDVKGVEDAKKKKEKRNDRLINAGISIVVFVIGTVIKWYFFDRHTPVK